MAIKAEGNGGRKGSFFLKAALAVALGLLIFLGVEPLFFGRPTAAISRLNEADYAQGYKDKQALIAKERSQVRLLFIGDSILSQFENPTVEYGFSDVDTWRHYYCGRNALELGFGGDTTANILWRIRDGELNGMSPSVIVLLVGANNLAIKRWSWSVNADVAGTVEDINELHGRMPNAHIILLAVLPFRGHEHEPIRAIDYQWKARSIRRINSQLADIYGNDKVPYVSFADLTRNFQTDGVTNTSLIADRVHPNQKGMAVLAAGIEPLVAKYMHDAPRNSNVLQPYPCALPPPEMPNLAE